LPNYPPKSWYKTPSLRHSFPIKIVYIGALGLDTMYTHEFTNWVNSQKGKVIWDIYSYNITEETISFFNNLKSEFIHLHNGVSYYELPTILSNYDVGVILYKGHIPNYVFNAPNKLFEYLVTGLDVWYPDVMKEISKFEINDACPKVLALNFSMLEQFDLGKAINKKLYSLITYDYFCENSLKKICSELQV